MDPMTLLFSTFALTLTIGLPISFALLLSSLLVVIKADFPLLLVMQKNRGYR